MIEGGGLYRAGPLRGRAVVLLGRKCLEDSSSLSSPLEVCRVVWGRILMGVGNCIRG